MRSGSDEALSSLDCFVLHSVSLMRGDLGVCRRFQGTGHTDTHMHIVSEYSRIRVQHSAVKPTVYRKSQHIPSSTCMYCAFLRACPFRLRTTMCYTIDDIIDTTVSSHSLRWTPQRDGQIVYHLDARSSKISRL
jgi:hypothetical protein